MKCDEAGGCPFLTIHRYVIDNNERKVNYCRRSEFEKVCRYELQYKRCHLDPSHFALIRAMLSGVFDCDHCHFKYLDDKMLERDCDFSRIGCRGCVQWQPRPEKPCPDCGGEGRIRRYGRDKLNYYVGCFDYCPTCHGKGEA